MPTPKHVFLAALDCPTKGWRTQHDAAAASPPYDANVTPAVEIWIQV